MGYGGPHAGYIAVREISAHLPGPTRRHVGRFARQGGPKGDDDRRADGCIAIAAVAGVTAFPSSPSEMRTRLIAAAGVRARTKV
jgi:hypothetical protein